jgi:hypothetical protein
MERSIKVSLNPFYTLSLTAEAKSPFTIVLEPPDKISKVTSVIVTFEVYSSSDVTYDLLVNGKPCNNNKFAISKDYTGTIQSKLNFDCTNIINKEGKYTLELKGSKDAGAITGWVDVTYINNPPGELSMHGTEYSPNDQATMFVQLKDSYGNPISNGSCYLDVWYPLNSSNIHPYTIQDAPMLKALGDDGIYYYDMTAPSTLGVYMLSAKCSYAFNFIDIYPPEETVYYPTEQIISGTWQGGGNPQVLNSRSDGLYERCDGSIALPCSANYTFNLSTYGTISNITNISVYFSGQTDTASRILTMQYWNGTTFINLNNTLTFSGTSSTIPTAYDEFLTNSIPLSAIYNGNTIKLKLTTAGSVRVFHNWLSLSLLSSSGTIQDVKGSGEMHITNIPNATTNQVWNYSNRTLTSLDVNATVSVNSTEIAQNVWDYNGTISDNILTQIATKIWNWVARYTHGVTI